MKAHGQCHAQQAHQLRAHLGAGARLLRDVCQAGAGAVRPVR
jgi:hypothetical protein